MRKYKFLEHTADVKFQAFGKTLEKAFENASYALINIMCKEKIKPLIKKQIKIKGKDLENLLYNFLEEFIFLLDSKDFLLGKIKNLKINKKNGDYELIVEALGDNAKNYKTELDVKAITYNEMFVKKQKDKFICQVVVDV